MSVVEDLEAAIAASQSALQKAKREDADQKRRDTFAQFEALGWRPAGTAPRDGTAFLGWNYQYDGRGVNCLRLMWHTAGGWCATDGADSQYGGYYRMSEGCFDLWLPIPPMPYVLRGKP